MYKDNCSTLDLDVSVSTELDEITNFLGLSSADLIRLRDKQISEKLLPSTCVRFVTIINRFQNYLHFVATL